MGGVLKEESEPADIVIHKTWPTLLTEAEDLQWLCYLRSRIGMCLSAIQSVVGSPSAEDFMVASPRSDKGVWRTDVWALKDFDP